MQGFLYLYYCSGVGSGSGSGAGGSVSVTGSVTVSVTVSVFVDTSVVSLGCVKDGVVSVAFCGRGDVACGGRSCGGLFL